MAPILSFTANEVWLALGLDPEQTVFEDYWYDLPAHGLSAERLAAWQAIIVARGLAAKEIEVLRAAGQVGSSLQAELDFYASETSFQALNSLGDDLRFVMITSSARVYKAVDSSQEKISVTASAHKKCERCWHYRADVGVDPAHGQICGRCLSNLFGQGEPRKHA
jgi:isoleucyl-tRNA synthetase